ncbi:hypothetical protein [Streptomyces sp. SD15]
MVLRASDGEVGLCAQAEDDLAVVGGGAAVAGDVEVAAARDQIQFAARAT